MHSNNTDKRLINDSTRREEVQMLVHRWIPEADKLIDAVIVIQTVNDL